MQDEISFFVKYYCSKGNSLIDMTFIPTSSRIIGGFIHQTLYESKAERKLRFVNLKCDVYLLRLLTEPTTVYDVIRKLGYAHSTAYNTLQEYLRQGIIEKVGSEPLKSGLVKKYYRLKDAGLGLLYVLEKLGENCVATSARNKKLSKACFPR
jgi:predicted transcriptional regulator